MNGNQTHLLRRALKNGATIVDSEGNEVEHEPRRKDDRFPWYVKGAPDVRLPAAECRAIWPDGWESSEALKGKPAPRRRPRPRRLGWAQAAILRTMQKTGQHRWDPAARWLIETSRTVPTMNSLVARGLLKRVGVHQYEITPAGQAWKLF